MECIEARAMKSSFYSEIDMKLSQQAFFDDSWCVTGINNFSSDDFSVDDLLDFSDKDFKDGSLEESEEEEEEEEEEKDSLSASSQDRTDDENSNSTTFSVPDDFDSFPSSDLPVTVDDLENLEWLSQFVDDSASERSLLCPAGLYKGRIERFPENPSESSKVKSVPVPLFPFPVPSKRRSKRSRARPSGRVWPLGPPSLSLTESSSTWCSSSYITSLNYPCMWTKPVEFVGIATKTPAKKQKKKREAETRNGCYQSQGQRRCSHCQVHKTPQWRTGPLGAKTLCNACGVRYKSGRLYPEYRPACSPTFSGHIHSNSHRKVLEMRRKKDTEMAGVTLEFGSTPTVSPLSAL